MKLILRQEAIKLGRKRYYTGQPCLRGHVSERLVSNKCCLQCRKLQWSLYYQTHKAYQKKAYRKWEATALPARVLWRALRKTRAYYVRLYINAVITRYKQGAIRRALPFKLTNKQTAKLLSGPCHYCGVYPKRKIGIMRGRRIYVYLNGIDRKNNNKGYTIANSVSCCWDCNLMKFRLGYKAFLNKISQIFSHVLGNH